ncbi:hypothetical protein STEG23_003420, partial [Scotinomys teguina]
MRSLTQEHTETQEEKQGANSSHTRVYSGVMHCGQTVAHTRVRWPKFPGQTNATAHMWKSENSLQKLVLFFHHLGPTDQECPQPETAMNNDYNSQHPLQLDINSLSYAFIPANAMPLSTSSEENKYPFMLL